MLRGKRKNGVIGGAGVVICGIIVFLFQQGYIELEKKPDLVTEEIYPAYQAYAGRDMTFTIKVHNQGEADGVNCHVYFNDGLTNPPTYSTSTVFPSVSTTEASITVTSGIYSEAGNYTISAYAQCSNSNPSNTITRVFAVEHS